MRIQRVDAMQLDLSINDDMTMAYYYCSAIQQEKSQSVVYHHYSAFWLTSLFVRVGFLKLERSNNVQPPPLLQAADLTYSGVYGRRRREWIFYPF
jgi:hypothetical protein